MDLSILIPARNEMFLRETVEDILKHREADTEVIVVMDGSPHDLKLVTNERVKVIYLQEPIGQRAAQNLACRLSRAKYVMKVDAHCSFDKGFDKKMIEFMDGMGEKTVGVPLMKNLWAFEWKCYYCGWKKYQGPTPEKCEGCGKTDRLFRKMVWYAKRGPNSTTYMFDKEPHFQYFNEYKKRDDYDKGGYNETMSLQGSAFMALRTDYWDLELCDERAGSWGNQGIEVACATWLSGGRVVCNHNTWYAHMFRTQGGDFSFPYENKGNDVARTKQYIKDKFWNQKHPKQTHPVSWLVERFNPPGWE